MSGKILITGSGGFIGKGLCERIGYDNIIPFDINDGDITDYDFSRYDISHICHLAAKTFVPKSADTPYEFYHVNFNGTLKMLEYCRLRGVGMTFLSAYTYGAPQYLPIDENHPVEAHSVYNHTKLLAEEVCAFYAKCYNISVAILRLFNVYGPGQRGEFLIPSIIRQALNSDTIEVMDLRPKRDYVYISDVLDAIMLSVKREGFNIYNVGSGVSYSVREIIEKICAVIGCDKRIIDKESPRENEVFDTVADITKIKNELGFTPRVNIDYGIGLTVEYYKKGVLP